MTSLTLCKFVPFQKGSVFPFPDEKQTVSIDTQITLQSTYFREQIHPVQKKFDWKLEDSPLAIMEMKLFF